jgi:hypothetical protein
LKTILLAAIGGIIAIAAGVGIALSGAFSPQSTENVDAVGTAPEFEPESTEPEVIQGGQEEPTFEEDQFSQDESSDQPSPEASVNSNIVIYQLHTEPSENAFSIMIPADWSISSSGVGTSADNTVQTIFQATSPDGQSTVGFQRPRPYSYLAPIGVYQQEGQIAYAGSFQVYNYRTADVYVPEILIPELQVPFPDIELVNQIIAPSEPGFSAGFFELSYSMDGTPYTMQVLVTTYGTPYSGQLPIWDADLLAVTAPTEEFNAEYAELAWNSLGSMRADSTFVQKYTQGLGRSSAFLSESYNESFFSALRSIQQSQDNLDAGFQGLSEATLGVHDVTDPNGNRYSVPNSHSNWYRGVNSGLFYGSDTGMPSVQEELVTLQ